MRSFAQQRQVESDLKQLEKATALVRPVQHELLPQAGQLESQLLVVRWTARLIRRSASRGPVQVFADQRGKSAKIDRLEKVSIASRLAGFSFTILEGVASEGDNRYVLEA